MLLAHIQFRKAGGCWDGILRKNFSDLLQWVKQGKVDAVKVETLTLEETAILKAEGFSLIPEEIVLGIGPARRQIKILKIERS